MKKGSDIQNILACERRELQIGNDDNNKHSLVPSNCTI